MPNTLSAAFNLHRSRTVDLNGDHTENAKNSRDYLVGKIVDIAATVIDFPKLYDNGYYLPYGSFARKTKVNPLDDIDLLQVLHGCGGSAIYMSSNIYEIQIPQSDLPLWLYTENGFVNSTKILNKFKAELENVPNYSNTAINRRGEAVKVDLNSYDWSFDIVPGFAVTDGADGIAHFLIPDGNGRWKRTDPRRDKELATRVNSFHNGNILPIIRVIKHWNEVSRHAPTIESYHLETMLLNGFSSHETPLTDVKSGIFNAFNILQSAILYTCNDPKGLDQPLDVNMDFQDRLDFSNAAKTMCERLSNAMMFELLGQHDNAIRTWQSVLPNFPDYQQ